MCALRHRSYATNLDSRGLAGSSFLTFPAKFVIEILAQISKTAVCLSLCTIPSLALAQAQESHGSIAPAYGKLPLAFEANEGQTDPQAKFIARGSGYSLFLTGQAAVLQLTKADSPQPQPINQKHPETAALKKAARNTSDTIQLELIGASRSAQPAGNDKLPGTANYFLGNDPSRWHANVPTYARVRYASVYPGVDLVYYGNQRKLEYDFVIAPGADAHQVQLHFDGATRVSLTPNGNLNVAAAHGEVAFDQPVIYQMHNEKREQVPGHFKLMADNNVGFVLGKYDHTRELVIDPTLEYSTYLGSTGPDYATAVTADASGSAYLTGYTYSVNFPTTKGSDQPVSAYTTNTSQSAVFVSKLNAAGSALVYSTFISGTSYHCNAGPNIDALVLTGDWGSALAVDAAGDVYVTGGTCANDFPVTAKAYQPTYPAQHHSTNVFITKLNPAGSALLFSTYLGGIGDSYSGDWANGIAIDSEGNSYVTGQTFSPNFPTTTGAFQTVNNNQSGWSNAFVTKMNPTGSALIYSSYLGGTGNSTTGEAGTAIAINSAGNAYLTGYSYSKDFPTTKGAFEATNPAYAVSGSSPFVTKVNPAGTALVYSTFLGGSPQPTALQDSANGIALDTAGNAYIAGGTSSAKFPVTKGAFQSTLLATNAYTNGFVSKLNPTGSALVYSTYLGGIGEKPCGGDRAYAIAIDAENDAYLAGSTCSTKFPTTSGAYQTTYKGASTSSPNAFLTELNPSGTGLLYSTFFGGSGVTQNTNGDFANGIAYNDGNIYLAGAAESTNLPVTATAYQKTNKATAGNSTAFVAKFAFATATTTSLTTDGTPQKVGVKVTFTADVAGASGSGTPTGTVGFSVDKAAPIAVALDDTGHAAYATAALAEGVHSVVATYSGDATHLASTSAALAETIYGAASTEASVSGSTQTAVYGAAFKTPLAVVVKDAKGDVTPGVVVTFAGTGLKFSSATATTGANGEASVTATATAAGALTAKATVAGVTAPVTFTALTGTKAVLKVTATNASVAFDAAIPKLTYTITGYVNGDTSKVVTGAPTETTTAKDGSTVGTYPITLGAGNLAATDYTFMLVNGTLTITGSGATPEPTVSQVITIADAGKGAVIYYTTNGTTPTTSSTVYKGPITLTATETLKFIAVALGMSPSPVRTVTDTIQ